MKRCLLMILAVLLMIPCVGRGEQAMFTATLYYPSADLDGLVAVERRIDASEGTRASLLIARELFKEPTGGALPVYGEGARLEYIEDSGSVITVSVETHRAIDERYAALSAFAIWKTLSFNTKVEGINVIVDSEAANFRGTSLNTMAALKSDINGFDQLLAAATSGRLYTIYYPDVSGRLLVPTLRETIAGDADEQALLKYLSASEGDSSLLCHWPNGFELWHGFDYTYGFDQSGRRYISLAYEEIEGNELRISTAFALTGMQQWQWLGSLALTTCTNLSGTERMKLRLTDIDIKSVTAANGETLDFPDGEMSRRLFRNEVSLSINAMSANENGQTLAQSLKLIKASDGLDNAMALHEALKGILSEGDIISVSAWGSEAKIELSGEFYAKSQKLGADEERDLIYAIVNAAYLNFRAANVSFTIEGEAAETFAGHVRMDTPLHPNMGMMK